MPLSRKKKLAFGLITTMIVVALLETAVRYSPLGPRLQEELPAREQARLVYTAYHQRAYGPVGPARQKPGPRLIAPLMPPLRKVRFEVPKPRGLFRVMLIGDSTAWGLIFGKDENDLSQTLPHYLEQELSARLRGPRLELINMGMPSAPTEIVLVRLQEAVRFEPDLILIYVGVNDANCHIVKALNDPEYMAKGWLRTQLKLLDLFAYLFITSTEVEFPLLPHDRYPTVTANFKRIAAVAREAGVPLVFILPLCREMENFEPVRVAILRGVRESGARSVDPYPVLLRAAKKRAGGFKGYFSDFAHPVGAGNRIIARFVAQAVADAGLLP